MNSLPTPDFRPLPTGTARRTIEFYRNDGTHFGRPNADGGVTHKVGSAAFDNLGTMTFHFRFFDDDNTGNSYDRMDNVVFSGAVIPEPSSLILI